MITEGLNHLLYEHPVKPNLQKVDNLIDKLKEAGWDHSDKDCGGRFEYGETKIPAKFMKLPKAEMGIYCY